MYAKEKVAAISIASILTFAFLLPVVTVYAKSPDPKLNITAFNGTGSTAAWVLDPSGAEFNSPGYDLQISTVSGSFAGAFYHGVESLTLGSLQHLGFDVKMISGAFAAGDPRLSILLSNGVTLFPDPFYCTNTMGADSYTHFDVVTDVTCTVFSVGGNAGIHGFSWSDTLTSSDVCTGGCGAVSISHIIMVQDSPPGTLNLGQLSAGCAVVKSPGSSSFIIGTAC